MRMAAVSVRQEDALHTHRRICSSSTGRGNSRPRPRLAGANPNSSEDALAILLGLREFAF
jgi:hypothetical protein